MNAHVMNRNKLLKIEMKSNTQGNGVLNKGPENSKNGFVATAIVSPLHSEIDLTFSTLN